MNEKYSLDNLRDIVLPEPPPLWPLASEVWWLLAIIVAALMFLFHQWRQAKKRNTYRRAGLALLDGASTAHDVSVILKRVALAVFPRERVASLYGEEWAAFLQQACNCGDFSIIVQADAYAPASDKIKRLAATWIRRHHAPRRAAQAEVR